MKATIESELARMKNSIFTSDSEFEAAKKMFKSILNTPICDQFDFDLNYINSLAKLRYEPKSKTIL